ncbi:MAG: ArsR family transcriptional regulator [Desulfobulbaceae bacterium]|nr:MAG: ArsR family transcriptional regulator [Desulfobulbaceae bacterium]
MKRDVTIVQNTPLCTPDQCQHIKKEAFGKFPLLHDDERIGLRAKFFQAVGNEVRLKIVSLLSVQEMCTCNIVEAVDGSNSTIAHHIKKLEEAGVIQSRRVGKFTIYRLNGEAIEKHNVLDT